MSLADSEIRRMVEILPSEVGSRRVGSDQLRALLNDLKGVLSRFSGFTVWRFGHDDILEYPVDRVPEAIDHYDVWRIYGRGYLGEEQTEPFIEIDLWAGGSLRNWDWLFRLHGPKAKVDAVAISLRDNIDRWPSTWHHWFHHHGWNWSLAGLFGALFLIRLTNFMVFPSSTGGLQIAVLGYLLAFMVLVVVGAGTLVPFIWFYRPGSPVETRRQWLPRLSIFAALAVLGGAAGNLLWSLVGK